MLRAALLVALLALVASGTVTAAGVERGPRLSVATASPLVVAGAGFAARERVTVTLVTLLGPRIRHIRAGAGGTFRVRLGTFTRPCGRPLAIRARGASGSSAAVRLAAPPCVPPAEQ